MAREAVKSSRAFDDPAYSAFRDRVFTEAVLCSPEQLLELCDELHGLIRLQRGWRRPPPAPARPTYRLAAG